MASSAAPHTPPFIRTGKPALISWLIASSMLLASVLAQQLRPTRLLADTRGNAPLSALVPSQFGDWQEVQAAQPVVNPQSRELIDTLYAEVLNRTYRNTAGQHVMLAIAYGRDQSDGLQVHEPLVCYPAQGFKVLGHRTETLATPYGALPVHRLETALEGTARVEPVTYWTTVGDHVIEPRALDKKRKKFSYSLDGYIPDGLLFRVSSISADTPVAFAAQDQFTKELLDSLTPEMRRRLAGLPSDINVER